MKVTAIRTALFNEGDDLVEFITQHVQHIPERSVLAVTSKIAALAEGRTATVANEKEKEALVRSESDTALPTKLVWLTLKDGMLMANAGIDESNAQGKIVLLPRDSYDSARVLRTKLREHYGVRELGIILTDSRVTPLRAGVVGVALGYAGFRGIKDYRGTKDLFGREFKFEQTNVADSLATAAVLPMGEGAEQQPLALIEDAPVEFVDEVDRTELRIAPEDDVYRPFFENL